DAVSPRRYLAIRIRPRQGELLRDGNRGRHFCIVTNRSDPQAGSGLELIRWHRQKAGTIEHAHDVLMNELAGAALPSQKFGANAAWLRFNVTLYNLLSAFKRIPPDPSGYASCCSTPSARSSAMPARPSCAAPRRSLEPSPERREPASPSNARLSRGLRAHGIPGLAGKGDRRAPIRQSLRHHLIGRPQQSPLRQELRVGAIGLCQPLGQALCRSRTAGRRQQRSEANQRKSPYRLAASKAETSG